MPLTESQAYAKMNQRVPSELERDPENRKGANRLLLPIKLEFSAAAVKEMVKHRARDVFAAPLNGLPGNPPSLDKIKNHIVDQSKPDPLDKYKDRVNAINNVLGKIDGANANPLAPPPMVKHTNEVNRIFEQLEKDIATKADLLSISVLDVKGRANLLIPMYYDVEKKLKEQCEKDKAELDKWIDDNLQDLQVIYQEEFKNGNAREIIKKNMEKLLNNQLQTEIQYLESLKNGMVESCNNINDYIRGLEAAQLSEYHEKATGITLANGKDFDPKKSLPEDGTRYDRYGNSFNVNGTIEINFDSPEFRGMSDSGKENLLYDRMIALKEAGYNSVSMTLSAFDGTSSGWFSNKPYNNELARLHWRAAIKAGFEPNKISIGGYKADEKDFTFHRRLRAMESYEKLGATNPGLQALFVENAERDLKKMSANSLGPYRAPILTNKQIQDLAELDFSKIQNANALKTALNNISPGLGNAISLPDDLKNREQQEKIRNLHADMIRNPLLRSIFKNAETSDGTHILDELNSEQIAALNMIDFSNSKYRNVVDVIDAFNQILRLNTGTKKYDFNNFMLGGKPVSHLKDPIFTPEKLANAQTEIKVDKLVFANSSTLKSELEQHHLALMGKNNDGLIHNIKATLDEIYNETPKEDISDVPTAEQIINHFNGQEQENGMQSKLIRSYHEVFEHAQQQLKSLELLCERLNNNGAFKDEEVRQAYKEKLTDVENAIKCLERAGKIKLPGGHPPNDEVQLTANKELPEVKKHGNFAEIQQLKQKLEDRKQTLLDKVASKNDQEKELPLLVKPKII